MVDDDYFDREAEQLRRYYTNKNRGRDPIVPRSGYYADEGDDIGE
jgi:hypothetical protein